MSHLWSAWFSWALRQWLQETSCRRLEVQPFLFPSPQGWQQCYLRLCPLGLWLLITAGCLCEQPSGVKFTALCISTLCWAEPPCTQAPWERGAAGQASPSSTQRQHPETGWEEEQPLLSSGAGVWAGLSLALQAWGELTGQQNSADAGEVKTGLACSTNDCCKDQRTKIQRNWTRGQSWGRKALVLCKDSEDGVWGSSSFWEDWESSSTM